MVKTTHARDRALWDRLVNDRFGGEQPILSVEESLVAARKLYRHAMGKPFPGRIEATSGNRYTWVRRGVLYVNPDKREGHTRGLRSIIHDLSHYCHSRLHPGDSGHSVRQARLERDLAKFALDRNWHRGGLAKPEPEAKPVEEAKPKADPVLVRYRRMVARRDRWKAAAERAERLLAKAEAEVRTYRRRHGSRLDA